MSYNKMLINQLSQLGGAKPTGNPIYCGSNVKVPKGKIRGRPNTCFKVGRKAGFYAGFLKGQQQAPRQAPQQAPQQQPISRRTVIQATEASLLAQQQRQRFKTEDEWRSLNQRAMQAQAKEWGIPRYSRARADLVDDFIREARRRNLVR
jgi:hypothetical protein